MYPLPVWDELFAEGQQLLAAWHGWRGAGLLPRKSEMRIADVRGILSRISLLEIHSLDMAIFRVAGSYLRERLGFELTGHNYLDLTPAGQRHIRGERTWLVAETPCGSYFRQRVTYPSGLTVLSVVLSVPLDRDEPGGNRYTLAVVRELGRTYGEPPSHGPKPLPMPDEFRFLDIGAGLPPPPWPGEPPGDADPAP